MTASDVVIVSVASIVQVVVLSSLRSKDALTEDAQFTNQGVNGFTVPQAIL
jgi:hypothetical protein